VRSAAERLAAAVVLVVLAAGCSQDPGPITGRVVAADGTPIAGATVRIQATATTVVTDAAGRFELETDEGAARLAAWAPDYYIGGGEEYAADAEVTIELHPLPAHDDPSYEWLSVSAGGTGENQGCAACHSREGTGLDVSLPVDQWRLDAHAASATNPRFLSMYAGTDLAGNQSPPTRYVSNRDYGRVPLPPDPNAPYSGPGYVLDFPETAGNCAACHVPMAAANDPYGVHPTEVDGVATEGIGCDFCHKVSDVRVSAGGLPDPAMPGVLSMEFLRPAEGHQFFAGPFDDVAPGEDAYSPLQLESRYCAPCHHGVFWDTVVYDSYGEWLRSPYSDPETGQTCQDCHMPPTGATIFALPAEGGLERDPATIAGHRMPGAADEELLRNAVTLTAEAARAGDTVDIAVTVTNDLTGHHVPTDSPLRQAILVVTAAGSGGEPLDLLAGPILPEWCGVGDPAAGRLAGLPGTVYAKVLEELWTEVSPTGAYWNPTRVIADTRLAAYASDTTRYTFEALPGTVSVEVRLLYRRAFIELMDHKGWDVADIEMERVDLTVP
jgi:hypothetical protein